MAKEDAIWAEGTVVEARPNGVFRVVLANGHGLMAHLSRRQRSVASRIRAGDKVNLELTPFDLSKGRILLNAEQTTEL